MERTRRDMLRLVAGVAAVTAFPLRLGASPASPADLVLVEGAGPAERVRAAIEAMGGMGRFVSRNDKVVVKPNMGFAHPPSRAATTEPAVVRAVVEEALSAGARQVLVFDNPCHQPDKAVDACGVSAALAGLDQTLVYTLRKDSLFAEVPLPNGKVLKKQHVAKDILEADSIINVPIAKSHGSARVTFGMKNWMGVVKDRRYWHVTVKLHQAIADIATLIRPRLTVLDATRVMVEGGPNGPGKVLPLDRLVAGVDPVAVDALGLTLAPWGGDGYSVGDVRHIGLAAEAGVGSHDLDSMEIRRLAI